MVEELGIDESRIPQLCDLLYKNYGTTMAGLRAVGYEFNNDHYHRLPYVDLKPDPVLRHLLLSQPLQKVILFDDSVRNIEAGERVASTQSLYALDGRWLLISALIYFESIIRWALLAGRIGQILSLESIHNIKEAVPELWEKAEKSNAVTYSREMMIETLVLLKMD